jgi:hypothetical protein
MVVRDPEAGMNVQPPEKSRSLPLIHLFCPQCGETATIRRIGPSMFPPLVNEITHACDDCGCETTVQIGMR